MDGDLGYEKHREVNLETDKNGKMGDQIVYQIHKCNVQNVSGTNEM